MSEVGQALDAVREMKTRAFGQVLTFLYSGALLAQRHPDRMPRRCAARLAEMTAAVLRRAADLRLSRPRALFSTNGLSRLAERRSDPARRSPSRRANLASRSSAGGSPARQARGSYLPNPARVMTHCNVSGELVAVAQCCRRVGQRIFRGRHGNPALPAGRALDCLGACSSGRCRCR